MTEEELRKLRESTAAYKMFAEKRLQYAALEALVQEALEAIELLNFDIDAEIAKANAALAAAENEVCMRVRVDVCVKKCAPFFRRLFGSIGMRLK